jgi:methyl coenzyme M reductase beta subunit
VAKEKKQSALEERTERLSAMYTKADRDRIEKVAEAKQCDVASLIRRGLDIVTDPAWASVKFEPDVYNALLEEANKKLWDLNTLTKAAVMAQYPEIFSRKRK